MSGIEKKIGISVFHGGKKTGKVVKHDPNALRNFRKEA